jgi:hypothetical protein
MLDHRDFKTVLRDEHSPYGKHLLLIRQVRYALRCAFVLSLDVTIHCCIPSDSLCRG